MFLRRQGWTVTCQEGDLEGDVLQRDEVALFPVFQTRRAHMVERKPEARDRYRMKVLGVS